MPLRGSDGGGWQSAVGECASSWADGTGLVWVVFCSDIDGPGDLYQREPDGDVRRLTELGATIDAVSITPDGATVIFEAVDRVDRQAQIWSLSRSGAQPRLLTSEGSNRDPMVDPSGSGIVFVSDRDGSPALWAMQVDGSDQHALLLASAD